MSDIDTRIKTQGASDYDFNLEKMYANVPMSMFQLGIENILTMDIGQIIPFSCMWTFPRDEMDISVENLIKAINVPKVATMSGMKMYIYYFWCSMPMLWDKWQLFFTKGHNADENLLIPKQNIEHTKSLVENGSYVDIREESLTDYLNVPYAETSDNKIKTTMPLFKPMMYLKIYRDYFMNEELHLNSKCWYPSEDSEFRLHGTDYNDPNWAIETEKSKYNETEVPKNGDCFKNLGMFEIKNRDYGVDYFSACKMKPIRGKVPSLDFEQNGGVPVGITDTTFKQMGAFLTKQSGTNLDIISYFSSASNSGAKASLGEKGTSDNGTGGIGTRTWKGLETDTSFKNTIKIVLDDLVKLQEEQMEMWKIARTDYTYGTEMETFWGVRPRSANTYKPVFIGGTKTPIIFSEVIQTSESTSNNPLGNLGGHAFGANQKGYVGHLTCDDYGMLMGVACIVPEVYYKNGMERTDMWNVQEDIYLPERSVLPPMAVLNAEISYTDDENFNIDPWGYTDSWDNLRMRQDQVHGKLKNPENLSFAPYVPERKMDKKPYHNQEWARVDNTTFSESWKSVANEVPFLVEFKEDIKCKRGLPYRGTPKGLTM